MFTGITNQFTNLLGKGGAEGAEQAGDAAAATAVASSPPPTATSPPADLTAEGALEGAEG